MPYRQEGTVLAHIFCRAARFRPDIIKQLILDLFTTQEIEEFERRWEIVRQLHKGRSQREVAHNLGISTTTVSRGARALQESAGGFRALLE